MIIFRAGDSDLLTGQRQVLTGNHLAAVNPELFSCVEGHVTLAAADRAAFIQLAVTVSRDFLAGLADGKTKPPGAHQAGFFLLPPMGFIVRFRGGGDGELMARVQADVLRTGDVTAADMQVFSGLEIDLIAAECGTQRLLVMHFVVGCH